MSDRFRERFEALRAELPIIRELRIQGMMIGVDLSIPATPAVGKCMERGVLVNATHDTVLRLLPALNVTDADVDRGCDVIAEVLGEMAAESEASDASAAVPGELGETLEEDGETPSDEAEVESDAEELDGGETGEAEDGEDES